MITLRDVYECRPLADGFLYELMGQAKPIEVISHRERPPFEEHVRFIDSNVFRRWFLVQSETLDWVGMIYATMQNEIGIRIHENYQGKGYGPEAVKALIEMLSPLEPLPAYRRGGWIANVAPANTRSKRMFESLGFREIQRTFARD